MAAQWEYKINTVAFTIGNAASYAHDTHTMGIEWV